MGRMRSRLVPWALCTFAAHACARPLQARLLAERPSELHRVVRLVGRPHAVVLGRLHVDAAIHAGSNRADHALPTLQAGGR